MRKTNLNANPFNYWATHFIEYKLITNEVCKVMTNDNKVKNIDPLSDKPIHTISNTNKILTTRQTCTKEVTEYLNEVDIILISNGTICKDKIEAKKILFVIRRCKGEMDKLITDADQT
jgi:hypothetical protein